MVETPVGHNSRRNLKGLGVLAAAAIGVSACSTTSGGASSTPTRSKTPPRIAVLVGTSGAFALNGQQIATGVKTAAAVLNAHGGVDGHKVQVTYEDDKSNPATAVQELRSVAGSGIHFVVGATTDPTCVAMLPIAEKLGVTMVSPTCEDNALTIPHPASNYFQVAPTDTGLAVGTATIAHMAYPNITKWVTSNPDFSFGHIFYPQFQKTLSAAAKGSTFSTPQFIPLTATSFNSYVTQVQSEANSSAGLVSSTFGQTLIGFIKTGSSVGLFNHFGGYLASAVMLPTLGALGSSVPNMWFSYTYFHSVFHNAANTTFVNKFRALNKGTDPSAWNEMAYVAVQGIAAGVQKAHSIDAAKVAKAMQGIKVDSPEGMIAIDAKTHIFRQDLAAIHVQPTSTSYTVVKSLTIPYAKYGK